MTLGFIKRRLRKASLNLSRAGEIAVGWVGRLRALVPAVRKVVAGERPGGARHAVYVHYDRWGVVHDFVFQALRELVANGYSVTFVSNSPKLDEAQIKSLLPLVREVVHRRNAGYDFGAYRDGIARLPDRGRIERLIIMNDSVYGPIFPLSQALEAAEAMDVDAFGITDTWEHGYHLQSYFVLFFPKALLSRAFNRFWSRFPTVGDKGWLIRNGEIRLSAVLAREKLRLGALCPYWDVSRKLLEPLEEMDLGENSPLSEAERGYFDRIRKLIILGKPINPSHYYWEALIRDWNCPFIKRELLQHNPAGIPRPWRWEVLLREKTAYDTNLISRHLQSL